MILTDFLMRSISPSITVPVSLKMILPQILDFGLLDLTAIHE